MASQVVVIKATLKYKNQNEMVRGMASHISKRGLIIHTRQTREVGSNVQFEFKLADGTQTYTGEGVVREVLKGSYPGMLIALKRINHAFKEVVTAILAGEEKKDTEISFSQRIVQGCEAGDILGDLDLDSGIDSLFSSIEKAPTELPSVPVNGLYSKQYDISESIESPSLSFEVGDAQNTESAEDRCEIDVDEFEHVLNCLGPSEAKKAEFVESVSKPVVESVSEQVAEAANEENVKETEQFFAVKRENSDVDAADEELKSIQAQTAEIAEENVKQSRLTTLTGFPIEEESPADLFAALQNEIFAMPSSDNAIIPESMLTEAEKGGVTVASPANQLGTTAPAPIAGINPVVLGTHVGAQENAEVRHVANPLLNRPSSPVAKPLSLDDLISQTSADATDKDAVKTTVPNATRRSEASLDALLKRADIKSKNVVLTDVNTRKATPRRRNTSDDGEPTIPVQRKGGFLSSLFKK